MPPKDWPLDEMEGRDTCPNHCQISLLVRSILLLLAHITQHAIVSAKAEGLFEIQMSLAHPLSAKASL